MKFDTFLEDFAWFAKTEKPGTTYLHPVKRDLSYVTPMKITMADKHHFMDQVEEYEADDGTTWLSRDIVKYKLINEASATLNRFVSKCVLNKDYVVYRNFGSKVDVTKLKVGSYIKPLTTNLMSTSLDHTVARMFARHGNSHQTDGKTHFWTARIQLKRGQKGCYVDAIDNENKAEKELLLPPSNLKVTGFSYVDLGHNVIHTVDCVL